MTIIVKEKGCPRWKAGLSSELMNVETFKIPKLKLTLEVFKNEAGHVQMTKIRKRQTTPEKLVKLKTIDFSKVSGLTNFQVKVYKALLKVKSGQVVTYKELAEKMGSPLAARAIGSAMRKNPFPYVVPCHRVVRGDGVIGNFSADGGSKTKALLLESEGINLSQKGRII